MHRINLQRFAEGEPEVNVDVTVTPTDDDTNTETPPVTTGEGELSTVNSLIFTQEQINEINQRVDALKSEIQSLWEQQFNDWKSQAISDLESRVYALETAELIDDATTETDTTTDSTTIVEPSSDVTTTTTTDTTTDESTTDETPSRKKPGFLF